MPWDVKCPNPDTSVEIPINTGEGDYLSWTSDAWTVDAWDIDAWKVSGVNEAQPRTDTWMEIPVNAQLTTDNC